MPNQYALVPVYERFSYEDHSFILHGAFNRNNAHAMEVEYLLKTTTSLEDLVFEWMRPSQRSVDFGFASTPHAGVLVVLRVGENDSAWLTVQAQDTGAVPVMSLLPLEASSHLQWIRQRDARLSVSWSDDCSGRVIDRTLAMQIACAYAQSPIGEARLRKIPRSVLDDDAEEFTCPGLDCLLGCFYRRECAPQVLSIGESFIVRVKH